MSHTVEPIAIIGLAARVPGARDVDEYWANLRDGRESISFLSDAELLENGVAPEQLADRDYVKAVPLVPDVRAFDADLFGMTTREAEICDPAIRLFMEVAHAGIENAGYDPRQVGEGFGVFAASGPCDYQDLHLRQSLKYRSADIFQMSTLNNTDYAATLTAYKLNLRGPAMTIVTACSSSLVALHMACQALRYGECDAAVVGGANVEMPYGFGHLWVPGAVRSSDGHCRPFDANASGTMFGSGSAAVVVKRLADAERDGDPIRALVLGSAINNDGSDKVSFSAPSIAGQTAVIMEAMAMAECHPRDISYIEAHGTATALGDPIEVTALAQAYRNLAGEDLPSGSIGIGSVKSNIGHLVWAAGVSQVAKVALALDHEELPATVNFTRPNPKLELERTPFYVNDRLREWPRVEGSPRRVGISSLGIGGTNAHVVLQEAPIRQPTTAPVRPRIVVWSGRSSEAVDAGRIRMADFLSREADDHFADVVATLQHGRAQHPVRAAAVGSNAAEVADALNAGTFISGDTGAAGRPVAFLFPGQGSQSSQMALQLSQSVPRYAELVEECLTRFAAAGVSLSEAWHSADAHALTDTQLAQPMLFTVEYALARLLQEWGVQPAVLLGHSIGELTAAAVAGVFSLDDAVRLITARAQAMGEAPLGAMVAVPAPGDDVEVMLSSSSPGSSGSEAAEPVNGLRTDLEDGSGDDSESRRPDGAASWPSLVVSVRNFADRAVVSGPLDDVAAFQRELASKGVETRQLETSHAFHSPMMAEAARNFADVMRTVELRPPGIAIISAATGLRITDEEATDPEFWAAQVEQPVRFDLALDELLSEPHALVEVGPGHVLTAIARRHDRVRERASIAIATLDSTSDEGLNEMRRVLAAAARIWVEGHDLNWSAISDCEPWHRMVVPGYPYQRKQHWVVPTSGPSAPKQSAEAAATNADEQPDDEVPRHVPDTILTVTEPEPATTPNPYAIRTWIEVPPPSARALAGQTALALLPSDREDAMAVLSPLLRAGARVIRVRPDERYAVSGDEYRVRPTHTADLEQMFVDLRDKGERVDLIVHAWATPPWEAPTKDTVGNQLSLSFGSLLSLVQRGGRWPGHPMPRLVVVASHVANVSGNESIDPVKATLVGLTCTWAREEPSTRPKVIDIAPGTSEWLVSHELCGDDNHEFVALRGHRRWVPVEKPLELAPGPEVLRECGVYVITGGLGGLGLAAGKALAGTGRRPRLVLTGRTGLPTDAKQLASADPKLRHVLAEIAEMTELGATVSTLTCDVGDPRQVKRMLDITTARFGTPNGVLHLAGVPGDGLLQLRSADDAQAVLRPKIIGTLVLEEALRDRPALDFFVSFSSRAALHGLIGSGDYAAANAALDALTATDGGPTRRLSINWPAWSTVGMAVDGADSVRAARRVRHLIDPDRDWILDEHRIDGRPVMPGTGYLDFVVSSARRLALVADDDAVELEDVAFQNAMVVDTQREMELSFTRLGTGWAFEVCSWPANTDPDETPTVRQIHVEGQLRGCRRTDNRQMPDNLHEGYVEVEPPSLKPGPGRLFTLGERWQNIDRMWRADEQRALVVELALPALCTDMDDCEAHPALLDGATASVRDVEDGLHLPFLYNRAVFHRRFPEVIYSQVRRRPSTPGVIIADITIVDREGVLLAEIDGYTMRKIDRPQFLDSPAMTGPSTAEAEVMSLDAPADEPDPVLVDGIDPDIGGRLLIELLAARTPDQVLIRPYVDGCPVPLPTEAVMTARSDAIEQRPENMAQAPVRTAQAAAVDQPSTPTSGSIQEALKAMWKEALGVDTVEPDDEFFDLGGDSLSSIQLMRRIRESFGVQLSVGVLFEFPTVRALSAEISRLAAD